jgi:hypothetical protein
MSSEKRLTSAQAAEARKQAASRRRREEAQLRILWEQEVERGHLLQLKIAENDKKIATLGRQREKALEEQQRELAEARSDLAAWNAKLVHARQGQAAKERTLQSIKQQQAALKSVLDEARMTLVDMFVPKEITPLDVNEEDVYPELEGFIASGGAARATRSASHRDTAFMTAAEASKLQEEAAKRRKQQSASASAALEEAVTELRILEDMVDSGLADLVL